MGSILGLVRSPGGGHGNLLQYSCLENPMDRRAWWATVHKVAKSPIRLKRLSTQACRTGSVTCFDSKESWKFDNHGTCTSCTGGEGIFKMSSHEPLRIGNGSCAGQWGRGGEVCGKRVKEFSKCARYHLNCWMKVGHKGS